jgi:hypothetical protein
MNIIQKHLGKFISLGVLAVFAGFFMTQYYGTFNYGVDTEEEIVATYTDMESTLAGYSLQVSEAAQIPGMKTEDLNSVMREAMTGRYGKDGSKAAFQWIKENYPGQVTDALYEKIQVIIEAGRNKFTNKQKRFIDIKRGYNASLKKTLVLSRGWWLTKIHDFPVIDLDEYVIISSEHAKDTFKTKVDKGLKIR